MLGNYAKATLIAACILLPSALALSDATRTYYLYTEGTPMTEGAPTNEDPTGLLTPYREQENVTYDARTLELTAPLRLRIEEAFRLHLDEREAVLPVERDFRTDVKIFLRRSDGAEVMRDFGRWYLGDHAATFHHPGGEVADAEGWTDFTFDANSTPPNRNACTIDDCVWIANGIVHIPAGMTLMFEEKIVRPGGCVLDLCAFFDGASQATASAIVETTDAVNELSPIDLYDPFGPIVGDCNGESCFDPVHSEIERRIRQQPVGRALAGTSQFNIAPVATWQSASTSSDSRLEIRLA